MNLEVELQRQLAADVWPTGVHLCCERCKKKRKASSAECGEFLRTGWPQCCGRIMTLVGERIAGTRGAI